MNIKIAKKEFLDSLNLSNRAISSTSPLPSLIGIKLSATENLLTLTSSDNNISIQTSIINNDTNTLVINEPGEIVIDAKYLLEIIRKIDSDYINLEIIDGSLIKIFGGNSEFKINGMPASSYPNIDFSVNNENTFKLPTTLFNQIIEETIFACSDNTTRPILTGVNLKAKDKKIYANATDTYRLASKVVSIDTNLNFNITIPAKYLNEVCHAISSEKEITIAIDKQKISFIFGNTIIDTKILDDDFPDVSKIIPTEFNQILTVNTKELNNAIDRSSFIKSDGKNIVKLNIKQNVVELTSSNQIGSSFETINVIKFEGEPFEISCSGKYLQDALKASGSEDIIIKFSGNLRPLIVVDENNPDLIQLISPVRT